MSFRVKIIYPLPVAPVDGVTVDRFEDGPTFDGLSDAAAFVTEHFGVDAYLGFSEGGDIPVKNKNDEVVAYLRSI